jgi:hypothetical protein
VGVAVRAELPVGPGSISTSWADRLLFNLRQERFLFQGVLVSLIDRLGRSQDEVDEQAEWPHDPGRQGRQYLDKGIVSSGTDIAVGPEDQAQPERSQERPKQGGQVLKCGGCGA